MADLEDGVQREKGREEIEEETAEVVAFLGPVASYTHQAARFLSPSSSSSSSSREKHILTPCTTIEDVFNAVQSRTATRGVVPFENSTNGAVVFTLDLFADRKGQYGDVVVSGEVYVRVRHCLLGRAVDPQRRMDETQKMAGALPAVGQKKCTPPAESQHAEASRSPPVDAQPLQHSFQHTSTAPDLHHVKKLYSHPQAWGQCNAFLNTHLKGVERQDVSSTSKAAELVAQESGGHSAAISSRVAAEVFGLDVLAEGIEEQGDNRTRFFVVERRDRRRMEVRNETAQISSTTNVGFTHRQDPISHESSSSSSTPSPHPPPTIATIATAPEPPSDYKTLVSLTIPPHSSRPGALAQALSIFARHGVNLTSINTRPNGLANWNYVFFLEMEGRRIGDGGARHEEGSNARLAELEEQHGREDGSVDAALAELETLCGGDGWRWLGSWESRAGL